MSAGETPLSECVCARESLLDAHTQSTHTQTRMDIVRLSHVQVRRFGKAFDDALWIGIPWRPPNLETHLLEPHE